MTGFQQSTRFRNALGVLDAANAEDPVLQEHQGTPTPRAVLYAQRMSETLGTYEPDAPETVCLAVRCQHFRRWTVPRESYPPGRAGYHRWRTELASLQAQWAGTILSEAGYPEEAVGRIQSLLRKERLREDPEAQLLEDTACLVFMNYYLVDFSKRHERTKIIGILRKTWGKMSVRGQAAARGLELPPRIAELLAEALREPISDTSKGPVQVTPEAKQAAP